MMSSYVDDFTVSAPFISGPKSTTILFTPQLAQSNTHHQVTLNNSILPMERTPCILGMTLDPHIKFNVRSLVDHALPRNNTLKALTDTNWGSKWKPYLSAIYPLSCVISCMQHPFGSSTPHHPFFRNFNQSKTLASA